MLKKYLQDSTTTTRRTLVSSVGENIRFTLPVSWSNYSGQAAVLVGAKERKLMHDSAKLTAFALLRSTLHTVEDAAHDIPLTQPDIVLSALNCQIAGFPHEGSTA